MKSDGHGPRIYLGPHAGQVKRPPTPSQRTSREPPLQCSNTLDPPGHTLTRGIVRDNAPPGPRPRHAPARALLSTAPIIIAVLVIIIVRRHTSQMQCPPRSPLRRAHCVEPKAPPSLARALTAAALTAAALTAARPSPRRHPCHVSQPYASEPYASEPYGASSGAVARLWAPRCGDDWAHTCCTMATTWPRADGMPLPLPLRQPRPPQESYWCA